MITLTNDFHNTEIRLNDRCGLLSAAQVNRSKKALCIEGCTCSDSLGTRGPQFWGRGEERQQVWIADRQDGGAEITGLYKGGENEQQNQQTID